MEKPDMSCDRSTGRRAALAVAVLAACGCLAEAEEPPDDGGSGPSTGCDLATCRRECVDLGYVSGACAPRCTCIGAAGRDEGTGGEDATGGDARTGSDGGSQIATCPEIAAEICSNGVDDDCDHLADCADPDCAGAEGCGGCIPSAEACEGGIDDDCDGAADCEDPDCASDPACAPSCPETEIVCEGNCNGYGGTNLDEPGEMDECMRHNDRGCSPGALYAWCHRGVDWGPGGPWFDYLADEVAAACPGGELVFQGDVDCVRAGRDDCGPLWYYCRQGGCWTYGCETPLVLAFDPAVPVAYRVDDGRSGFDLSAKGDGSGEHTDWPAAATPWLAMDRDGDGRISSGKELFGSATPAGDATASHGFEALAPLDADGDGDVDADDPAFGRMVLWADDGDRVSGPDELRSLAQAGVVRLDLAYRTAPRCDARGNCEIERSRFLWMDPDGALREGALVDVHLAVRRPAGAAGRPGADRAVP